MRVLAIIMFSVLLSPATARAGTHVEERVDALPTATVSILNAAGSVRIEGKDGMVCFSLSQMPPHARWLQPGDEVFTTEAARLGSVWKNPVARRGKATPAHRSPQPKAMQNRA